MYVHPFKIFSLFICVFATNKLIRNTRVSDNCICFSNQSSWNPWGHASAHRTRSGFHNSAWSRLCAPTPPRPSPPCRPWDNLKIMGVRFTSDYRHNHLITFMMITVFINAINHWQGEAIYHLYFIQGQYLHSTSSSYLLTDPPCLILLIDEAQAFSIFLPWR